MVQERIRDLFEMHYPDYCGENGHFLSQIEEYLTSDAIILDAGCGSGRMASHDFRSRGKIVLGIDRAADVKENGSLTHALRGTMEDMPLKDGSVDLILCRYVLEHLVEPTRAFREMSRVLREKGKLVLLTPNLWHYVTLLSRLMPWEVHRWFNRAYGVADNDTFRTFYRANTRRRIARLASRAGLRVVRMESLETSPNYLEFSRLFYRLGILYERMVSNVSWCSGLRVNIIATLEKNTNESVPAENTGVPSMRR